MGVPLLQVPGIFVDSVSALLCFGQFLLQVSLLGASLAFPNAPCMEYLPTCTINLSQMPVNIPTGSIFV